MADILLPSTCAFCRSSVAGSSIPYFCADCWSEFAPIQGAICPACGRPFGSPEALSKSSGHRCSACRQDPPEFDQAVSVGQFEGPLREAIHQFKYRPCRALGRPLGGWMAENIRIVDRVDIVMPVPLHRKRLRERGFNQSLLLAAELASRTGLLLSYDNLQRIRATQPQVELSGDDRNRNVAGAFTLNRPDAVTGRRIVLVDDVYTTGATLRECARVLRNGGAAAITALTLARAQ